MKWLILLAALGLAAGCTDAEFLGIHKPEMVRMPDGKVVPIGVAERMVGLPPLPDNRAAVPTGCAYYHALLDQDYAEAVSSGLVQPTSGPYALPGTAPPGWVSPYQDSQASELYQDGCR